MFKRLRNSLKNRDFVFLGLEVIVVIFSILVAFELDRWAEHRRERQQELSYLVRLKQDLNIEIGHMDAALSYAESRIAAALFLEEIVEDPSSVVDDPDAVPWALERASWRSFPQIDAYVYSELQSSGKLSLIQSESLRRALAGYYTSLKHESQVGLDLSIQRQFDFYTAGILSSEELWKIEDGSWNDQPINITAERAVDITEQLASRQNAMNLIPGIVQHHVFNKKVMEMSRTKALDIIEQIDLLVADSVR
jgi:hypothetical protein